jgi:pimeloyl-ACP methyl ester carboxylesterase
VSILSRQPVADTVARLFAAAIRRRDLRGQLHVAPAGPPITVPTITIGSDFDGPNKDGAAYRKMFTGPYSHRILDGVGHNVPQEALQAFSDAVVAADKQ